ncbi:MAG: DNA polymerase III subunit gamma/tau [Lachnospiraceae bacterium]
MSYTALYRKWRPEKFEDVRGQDHIVKTLRNQILSNRIGHAYLFCGTRGTGKTTLAKIFARAVNCEHTVDGSPCNQCALCQSIKSGASVNVVEIDAASNNGVDNIREIRDEVRYSPTEGKYRVYIIDEVHMLSTGAFNALLKTLEEPPAYVIFILATTEVQKIPITVLSRCQRYDFRRIANQTIEQQLRFLVDEEGVKAEEEALAYIARTADGSMRDALSLLEQCISFYYGERLTYEKALEVLGAVDTSVFSKVLRCVLDKNVAGCVQQLDEVFAQGRDLNQFVTDFIWYLRSILLVQTADKAENVLDMSRDNLMALKEESKMLALETLLRYIRVLSELSNQIRYASAKRVLIEVALIKLMKPEMEQDIESLAQRISDLESQLAGGVVTIQSGENKNFSRVQASLKEEEAAAQSLDDVQVSPAQYEDYMQLKRDWKSILQGLFPMYRSCMQDTYIGFDRATGKVSVLFEDELHYRIMKTSDDKLEDICRVLEERYHRKFDICFQLAREAHRANPVPSSDLGIEGVQELSEDSISIPGINMDIGFV